MAYWQVHADMPGGGKMWFGVEAEDEQAARDTALLVLHCTEASDLRVIKIPDPAQRLL